MGIDQVTLNFNSATLTIMNILIGFIMFGVALDLKVDDFKRTLSTPKPVLIGLVAQFFLLPAFTFLLVMVVKPLPSIALGLFLVAACPGGNLSNFLTYLGKGNTPLSISMSAISTVLAIFMTPFNTLFWGSLYPGTNALMRSFSISPVDMLLTIFIMLGVPLVLGMYIGNKYPGWASRTNKWMKRFSIIFFILFVLASLASNFNYFLDFVGMVAIVVFLHNLVAILLGYFSSRVAGLPEQDRRAIAIEVGIQNSGLGLILIFNFFDGLGGMAIVAAWWAIWHIVSGLSLATFWSKREPKTQAINGGIQV
ncbi:bile acid:sodium symporter family protein [Mesobacillus selenatarsenatis]|uniref:Na(+) dependent transporter,sodium Bile acid symporter family n=1 Tax=Mesobacillus selenatarsenatis (strain DSM 18680 / JCM 14380 / FERM P-15431 / SF-1) TaxID=1321606 RepID=A0A0A8WXT0_MESS1|nr:bile acid:sodium symporter family protein [Mesobacillus selenatarsenatis]GAM12490.1 Na(+) dependent transporter,sodium Bile acid symporter family [Mesobacillus selenatarsenatis SF-1]